MKTNLKRVLSLVCALALCIGMLPMSALAAGNPSSDQTKKVYSDSASGVVIEKSVSGNEASGYKLTMEAYVTGTVESTDKAVPLDIVLVLDQSGSMRHDLGDLQDAVGDFVETIQTNAVENNVTHRIALVGFASDENDGRSNSGSVSDGSDENTYVNTGLYINGYLKNYETSDSYQEIYRDQLDTSQTYYFFNDGEPRNVTYNRDRQEWGYWGWRDQWHSVTPKYSEDDWRNTQFYERIEGESLTAQDYQDALVSVSDASVSTAIDNLAASGATRTSLGMEMARKVFANNDAEGRKRVVVVFTDGEPGRSSYESGEAGAAVNEAYTIKHTYDADVYTIGFYNYASDYVTDFMNYLSSNYPNAEYEDGDWSGVGRRDEHTTGYYMTTSNSSGLGEIFETIGDSITKPSVEVGSDSVLTDTLSEYFVFGDTVKNVNGQWEGVEVTVMNASGSDRAPTWTEATSQPEDIEVEISGKEITVTGFDYSANPVVQDDGGQWNGSKLVFTFDIQPDKGCTNWKESGYYDTNSSAGLEYGDDGSTLVNGSPNAYVTTHSITYQFVSGTADKELPTGVTDQLVQPDVTHYISGQTPENELADETYTNVEADGGIWTPGTWEKTEDDGNVTYTLPWTWTVKEVQALSVKKEITKVTKPDGTPYNPTPTEVKAGDTITYQITVENEGNVDLTNVQISDTFNGKGKLVFDQGVNPGVSYSDTDGIFTIGSLAKDGGPVIITVTYTVSPDDSGNIINSATSKLDDDDTDDETTIPVAKQYTITYTVTNGTASGDGFTNSAAGSVTVDEGGSVTITFAPTPGYVLDTVTVDGAAGELTDGSYYPFPNVTENHNIDVVYAEDKNEDSIPDKYQATVTYNVVNGTWQDGTSDPIEVVFTLYEYEDGVWTKKDPAPTLGDTIPTGMKPDSTHIDEGSWDEKISSDTTVTENVTYTYNFDTPIKRAVSIEKNLTKVNGNAYEEGTKVDVDDVLTYEITVTNIGNVDLENVEIIDTFDGKGGLAFNEDNNPGVTYTNGTFTIGRLLKDGEPVVITVTYIVLDGDAGNTITNTAVAADDIEDNGGGKEVVEVTSPNVSVEKKLTGVKRDGKDIAVTDGMKVYVDDTLTWTITVTNSGDADATDLKLVDTLKADGVEIESGVVITAPADINLNAFTVPANNGSEDGEVEFTATYTITDPVKPGDILTNKAAVDGNTGKDTPPEGETENPVGDPKMEVTKSLTQITDSEGTTTAVNEGDALTAKLNDVLTYEVEVKNKGDEPLQNVVVSDDKWTAGMSITVDGEPKAVADDGTYTIGEIAQNTAVTIIYTYKVTEDDVEKGSVQNNVTAKGDGSEDTDKETVWVGNVTITPADITVYTGGAGYSGVTDEDGDVISGTETSGLPEPGYHIELPADVTTWLDAHGIRNGTDLSNKLTFTYNLPGADGTSVIRTWALHYVGIYSTSPLRNVYSLEPTMDTPPVRLLFTDSNGDEITSDAVLEMDENTVSATYSMTINPGELDQSEIKAVFTVGEESITCNIKIEPGDLIVRSVVNQDPETNTTEIAEAATGEALVDNSITAVDNDSVTYFVNNSEVKIPVEENADRVQLLVDKVSNSGTFNAAMGEDAIDHISDSLSNATYELAYLDLVDTENGNAVVTMDDNDKLTIYWPVPDDAASNSDFHIVHYTGMDRHDEDSIVGENELANAPKETPEVRTETIDGQKYVVFEADSFSPFVLVYEEEDNTDPDPGRPSRPSHRPDRDDEPEDLNTEDHVGYLIGFTDGTIRPEDDISRAEVATIFFRLLTDEARETYWSQTNSYSDVAPDAWYNNAVSTLSNMGILDGYLDGTFRPNAPITRSEFTKIAVSFFDYAAEEYSYEGWFSDVQGREWFVEYLTAAIEYGLIEGMPDGTFRPLDNITRAEAATIVNRTLGREPHEDYLLSRREMITWPDNSASAWYYADMQEATNSHDYAWIVINEDEDDEMEVEEWTDKLDERDWAELEQTWSDAYDAPGGEVMD